MECIDQRALPAAVAVSHAFEVEVGEAVGLDGFLGDARPEHGVSVGAPREVDAGGADEDVAGGAV